jgi:dTDP-4-dehydrorhamnose reductase
MFNFNKKRLLFYGHSGWIGGMFIEFLQKNYKNLKIIRGSARLDSIEQVKHEIKKYKPTHIISFTGRTHGTIDGKVVNTIDYLEYPGKLVENIKDNLYGPMVLANLCKKKGIHYTYLGTGCIFNNKNPGQKFNEDSAPNYFGSGYSVVKGFTDLLMKQYPVLNLRIRMPISSVSNERNFINKILNYSKICSIENSMTVLDDFFPIFADLILKRKTGTFNCTNPGTIEHNKILEMYNNIVDPTFKWENMSLEEQAKILKSERSNNYLDTTKIENLYKIEPIDVSVKKIIEKMKSSFSKA